MANPHPRSLVATFALLAVLATAVSAVRHDSESSMGTLATLRAEEGRTEAAELDANTDDFNTDDPSCPDAGSESHGGCDDPIANGTAFDLWELARSWTPGFCASGGKRTCVKKECSADIIPALTLHGLWPSFSKPVGSDAADVQTDTTDVRTLGPRRAGVEPFQGTSGATVSSSSCFWPQNCAEPSWLTGSDASSWEYDAKLLPVGLENEDLAPAWYSDGLGEHEWPKHGRCASWADTTGVIPGFDQASYYAATFDLARNEGTPKGLVDATGSALPLGDLQALFGGSKRVALGCTSKCELVQVVTCYVQGSGTAENTVGPRERADCPCTGVRDSHYDNSCAEAHACAEVKILSPEQAGCGGHPSPDICGDGLKCCPGVLGPACSEDLDCVGESGCARCAHSGHCTSEPRQK